MEALFADPRSFVSLLGLLVSIAGSIYAWVSQRNKAQTAEIDTLEAANAALERRVAKLENELEHMPDKDLVTDIRLALAKLEGTVSTLGEKVGGVAHLVGVIDEAIRNGNSK